MEDRDKWEEVCHLLKIWHFIKDRGLHWPKAVGVLEERINILTNDFSEAPYGG